MRLTWVAAILAIGSLVWLVYFGADVAVLVRGQGRVPPEILRLAQAGQKNIDKGSAVEIAQALIVTAVPQGVVAGWLFLGWAELDPIARLILAGELLVAAIMSLALWRSVARHQPR